MPETIDGVRAALRTQEDRLEAVAQPTGILGFVLRRRLGDETWHDDP